MALGLLLVLTAIALASAYYFAQQGWWMPPGAAAHAAELDAQFSLTFIVLGVVFVAAQLALGMLAWRYRQQRGGRAEHIQGHAGLEIVWTVATAVIFMGLAAVGFSAWNQVRLAPTSEDAVTVEVTSIQFAWYFRYPGADGKFGRTSRELMDAALGNPVGVDDSDPAAADDVVSSVLVLPLEREANLELRAPDVIHSFFVPTMRVKQDAVPGLRTSLRFRPTVAGEHEIACAELCGLGHYRMKGVLRVVSASEFDEWMRAQLAEKEAD